MCDMDESYEKSVSHFVVLLVWILQKRDETAIFFGTLGLKGLYL